MISWKAMNSGVPRSVLANNSYQNSFMKSWKIMNSYPNSWKKNMILGVPKSVPSKNSCIWIHIWTQFLWIYIRIHIWINICEYSKYEFIYELYSSYTNKHNMAIRVFQIWQSGFSRSEQLWWRRVTESVRRLWWPKEGRGAIGDRRAAASN